MNMQRTKVCVYIDVSASVCVCVCMSAPIVNECAVNTPAYALAYTIRTPAYTIRTLAYALL